MTLIVFQCCDCGAVTNAHQKIVELAPPRGRCPVCGSDQHRGQDSGFNYVKFEPDEKGEAESALGTSIELAGKNQGYVWYFPMT